MASLVTISQKCQYALRAMYELALHYPSDRVTVLSEIANAQDIPVRFLELIIAKLRKEGYVRSQRGQSGGYVIARSPSQITVGEIFRAMEGSDAEINFRKGYEEQYEKTDSFIFKSLYEEARRAISQVFDTKTLQDLMEKRKNNMGAFDYKI
jgi:Rrf2 family transcriptional regulator, cysteine metabolism repressor